MAIDAKPPREQAEQILQTIGREASTASDASSAAGAMVGVGYARLAIHGELRAIRERMPERPTTGGSVSFGTISI